MATAEAILRSGMFPKELPPPFTTASLGDLFAAKANQFPADFNPNGPKALTAVHNLARPDALRRQLRIPNPVPFVALARQIEHDWPQLIAHCISSTLSLSTPDLSPSKLNGRAIGRKHSLNDLPEHRARARARSKYVARADVSLFYPSIYTHSIPWALNTKPVAKAAFANNTLHNLTGDALDKRVARCQGAQTAGIPIGPDTSLVLADCILTAVDAVVGPSVADAAFRYIDDYEAGFTTYSAAEQWLAELQGALSDFELQLNGEKTRICDLPLPIETIGVAELRIFEFDDSSNSSQRYGLVRYFDRAFEIAAATRRDSVLRYAVARMNGVTIKPANWPLYQDLILQCATSEPGTLPFVIDQLKYYSDAGFVLNMNLLKAAFSGLVVEQARKAHSSEVAWALWGAILLGVQLDPAAIVPLSQVDDNVVALLALDASSQGLLGDVITAPKWESCMTAPELLSDNWLLAYEANVQGWLIPANDNVAGQPAFAWLKAEGVKFYDVGKKDNYAPMKAVHGVPIIDGGGGGSA